MGESHAWESATHGGGLENEATQKCDCVVVGKLT